MTEWTDDELDALSRVGEIRIAGRRSDGILRKPVIIWGVRVDDGYFIRSVNGADAAWFRGTRPRHEGHLHADRIERDVTFEDLDAADPVNERIDAAYRGKYGADSTDVDAINAPKARLTTLRVRPS